MASRWMQGMKARERRFRRQLGNLSLTDNEKKFYRRKVYLNKQGVVYKVETIDEHIERMETTAAKERIQPTEPWRFLARILQATETLSKYPLNADERTIIQNKLRSIKLSDDKIIQQTVADAEKAILRYRRLVRIPDEERKAKEKAIAKRVKLEALKGKK